MGAAYEAPETLLQRHLREGQRLVVQTLAHYIGRGVDVAVLWSCGMGLQGVALNISIVPLLPGEPVPVPPGFTREHLNLYAMSKVEGPPISDEAFVTATTR